MTPPAGSRRHLPNSPFRTPAAVPVEDFAPDDMVTHDKYGVGKIVTLEGENAVTVDFGGNRIRVKAPYTKLFKL